MNRKIISLCQIILINIKKIFWNAFIELEEREKAKNILKNRKYGKYK